MTREGFKKTVTSNYEEFVKKYKEDEWEKIGEWNSPLFTCDLFMNSMNIYYHRDFDYEFPTTDYLFSKHSVFVGKKSKRIVVDFLSKKLDDKDFDFFYKSIGKQQVAAKKVIDYVDSIKKIDENFPKKTEEFFRLVGFLLTIWETNRCLSGILEEKIAKRFEYLKITNIILPELLEEDTISDVSKYQKEIEKLAKRLLSNDISKSDLEYKEICLGLIKKYDYIKTYLTTGTPLDMHSLNEDIEKTIKEFRENMKHETKTIKLDDDLLKNYVKITNLYAHSRLANIEKVNRAVYIYSKFRDKIIEKSGLGRKAFDNMLLSWFLDYLDGKKDFIDKKYYVDKHSSVISTRDTNYVLSPEETEEFYDKYIKVDTNVDKLEGNPTFKGVVKGKVKVIMGSKEFNKMEEGDVLVCSMTDPNYLPVMKKAAAIVTDIGGILCHAAIVSRELRKPCIINTKIATKVFKDGDVVEVDANRGVIRKL